MSFTHIIFHTLYALVSRLTCSTGKVAAQHRKAPYRAAQRFSAWVANRHLVQLLRSIRETKTAYLFRRVPLKKSRSLYFSCRLSGQMYGIRLRSAGQGADFRSYPLRGCRVSLLPFALPRFRVSARVTPLSLGTGRQDNLTGRAENWATN